MQFVIVIKKEVHIPEWSELRRKIVFGKIVCISCGFFARYGKSGREFRLKSFFGSDAEAQQPPGSGDSVFKILVIKVIFVSRDKAI